MDGSVSKYGEWALIAGAAEGIGMEDRLYCCNLTWGIPRKVAGKLISKSIAKMYAGL